MPARNPHFRRAFTLLELLVVFTIIAILISVFMMIGHRIMAGSKTRATQNILQSLDQAMEAYIQAKGGNATRFPDRLIDANKYEFPLADAWIGSTLIPSGEFTVEVLKNEPASAAVIQKIPSEFIETVAPTNATPIPSINGQFPKRAAQAAPVNIEFVRVKDAWGRPIRFVHPAYHGIYGSGSNPARDVSLRGSSGLGTINITRNWSATAAATDPVGDGGYCKGGRPYFYSAGPDGNPATVEDNVYSNAPQFDAAVKAAGQ